MEIRKVTPSDDFNAISCIYASSWRAAYKDIVPREYLDGLSDTHWSDTLSSCSWDSFVAVIDGKYVGTTSVSPARDEAMSGWGEIISIYLLPEYIGKGLGKRLLDTAVSELTKMGCVKIYLWVLEDNIKARIFYEKNGFMASPDKILINVGGRDLTEIRYIYSF